MATIIPVSYTHLDVYKRQMYNEVLIGRMANSIRDRESVIMQSIFDFTPEFKTQTLTIPPISGSTQRVRTCLLYTSFNSSPSVLFCSSTVTFP